jgi:hypothetical protein
MKRCVTVVDGPLAFGMHRFEAARANDVGLEVLTLPLLASRLAGGFRHLADRETLSLATCAYRKSHPAILMVQSAQDRAADEIPGPLNAARDRGILVQ